MVKLWLRQKDNAFEHGLSMVMSMTMVGHDAQTMVNHAFDCCPWLGQMSNVFDFGSTMVISDTLSKVMINHALYC